MLEGVEDPDVGPPDAQLDDVVIGARRPDHLRLAILLEGFLDLFEDLPIHLAEVILVHWQAENLLEESDVLRTPRGQIDAIQVQRPALEVHDWLRLGVEEDAVDAEAQLHLEVLSDLVHGNCEGCEDCEAGLRCLEDVEDGRRQLKNVNREPKWRRILSDSFDTHRLRTHLEGLALLVCSACLPACVL